MKKKHLEINENTWELLNDAGRKSETYDQIIRKTLKKAGLKVD